MSDILTSPRDDNAAPTPVLTVCVTCRRGLSAAELGNAPVPGREFYEALAQDAQENGVTLRAVECMSLCARGGAATVSMPGKWTLVLGNLGIEKLDDFKTWLGLYAASKNGIVAASKRPPTLSDMVVARIPAES